MANPNGKCQVCKSPERHRLEMHLAAGASEAHIARKFSLSYYAVRRHWRRHVGDPRKALLIAGPLKVAEAVDRAAEEGAALIDYVTLMRNLILDQLLDAREAGDGHLFAQLSGRAIEVLRMIAQMDGLLFRGTSVTINNTNFFVHPMFAQIEEMLYRKLRAVPEAHALVAQGFRELQAKVIDGHAQ